MNVSEFLSLECLSFGGFYYISTVEEERFTHELRRDGLKTAKMLKDKGIVSPSLVGAVKINHNTWVVPKKNKDENFKQEHKNFKR